MKSSIGFVVVGQAGGNIGHLLEQKGFDVLYLNSSKGDLDTINTDKRKKYHIANGIGCAKDRLVSKELIKNDYKEVLENIEKVLHDKIFIYIIFSTGGGTGSGASPMLASLSIKHLQKKVGLITVLPSEDDTLQAHINSYECFQEIAKIDDLGSTFVLDNNMSKSNVFQINERFVQLFDKVFDYKKYETTKGNVDEAEILKLLNTSGMSIIATCKNNQKTVDLISKIKSGIFAPLENDARLKYLGLFKSIKFDDELFIREIGKYIDKFENQSSDNTVAILSGLTLPFSRIIQMRDKIQKEKDILVREEVQNPLNDLGLDFLDISIKEEVQEQQKSINDIFDEFF